MVSPVKSWSTHYDDLGLTPAATPDEIAEAFAKQIHITITSPEEAVEHANKVYVAYETLRDPISRRLYDAAIGIWPASAASPQDRFEEAAEPKVEPFIGATAGESPEYLHDASPGGTLRPAKTDRRRVRRASRTATDRKALGGTPGAAKTGRRQARRRKKAAIEWPVPNTKSLDERPATHVDLAALGGTPESGKEDRRHAKRGKKAASDREALHAATEQRKSAAEPRPGDAITEDRRGEALHGADPARSDPASHRARTYRRTDGAGAGVVIVGFGVLVLVVALVRGDSGQTPKTPRQQITTTADQSSVNTTATTRTAGEQIPTVDQTQSGAPGEASPPGSAPEPARQLRAGPELVSNTRVLVDLLAATPSEQAGDQQATHTQFQQYASREAAATPSQQSATRRTAGTPPQLIANRQTARTPPQQWANRQSARTPPQQVLYRQTLPAAQGRAIAWEGARGKVLSSAVGKKICKQLPSSWSRLPLRACLTMMEWKQVEEELR